MTISLGENKSQLTRLAEDFRFQKLAEHVESYMASREYELATVAGPVVPGKTRIPLNIPTYGAPEVIEALDSLLSTWVTMGKKVARFEEMWAEYVGKWMGVMTNSGSSANLLALSALNLQPGDEVITPALTWATTVFPIAQVGAVPVLVDVDRETYNISPEAIERAITPRTRAIMPVHLLGNPCNMTAIMDIAHTHRLFVIEDACEAHGAEYGGRKVGSFGDLSTFSFFFSHHISTIEGGMVVTSNSIWADQARSQRAHGWIREIPTKHYTEAEYPNIDPRFLFLHAGYNFRPTEIAGAFGIHQLPRLEELVETRREAAKYITNNLARYQDWIQLPSESPGTRHSYFAYPVLVKEAAPFTKKALQSFLEGKGLETRQIEAGNIALQPAMKRINYRVGDLTNAQYIHENGFFFGLHSGIGQVEREAIVDYFHQFFAMIGAS